MTQCDIEERLKPLIDDLGFELWGCEYISQGKHSVLRLYIDKEGGVSIDDCQLVSRQVGAQLDVDNLISSQYNLEVSSPGIERSLFRKEHYQRYLGYDVSLKLSKSIHGTRKLLGTILSVNDDHLRLGLNETQEEVPFTHIVKANLIGKQG